jgi:hypothetical protein
VAGRIADRSRWDRATAGGLAALGLVAVTPAEGIGWSLGGSLSVAGYKTGSFAGNAPRTSATSRSPTGPDPGALASTVWSSFTPEGRGAA